MERGNEKALVYLEMLSLSLENDNKIIFEHVEESFEEEIALELDEDVELVRETLAYLKEQNLVEHVGDEYIFVEVFDLTGSESESKKRVKKHREKKNEEKLKENSESINYDVTKCNENVTAEKEKEREKEKEKELDKDIEKQKGCVTYLSSKSKNENTEGENLAKIIKCYEENMGPVYPANRDWFLSVSEKIEADLFKRAIEICIDKNHMTPSYLKGIIRRWENEQIFTLSQLKSKEMEEKNNKQNLKNKNSQGDKVPNYIEEDEKIDEKILQEMRDLEEKLGVS